MCSLEFYLNSLASHPKLSKSNLLLDFLEGDAADFFMPASDNPVDCLKPKSSNIQCFESSNYKISERYGYCLALSPPLAILDSNFTFITKHYFDSSALYNKLREGVIALRDSDSLADEPSLAFSKLFEELALFFVKFGHRYLRSVVIPLHAQHLTTTSVQRTLAYENDLVVHKETLHDLVNKKTRDKIACEGGQLGLSFGRFVGKNSEQIQREKLEHLDADINDLQKKKSKVERLLEEQSVVISQEFNEWDSRRGTCIKTALRSLVDCQIQHARLQIDLFKSLLSVIVKTDS
ncbi:uncharacterized protein LOC135121165 [Zophobas morio]|uniref:uncharacterized protein LOC135121165 n=1 Tax=Zophobas morio TaxID=2755281 RepID=UPI0030830234